MQSTIHNSHIYERSVIIYGYEYNDIDWDNTGKEIYMSTSGMIIKDPKTNRKYIITSRSDLMSCKKIMIHYCMYHKQCECIYRQDMQILFQCAEYDIVILGSDNGYFDHSKSELVSTTYGKIFDDVRDVSHYEIETPCDIPKKNKKNFFNIIDMEITDDDINYDMHIYETKYVKTDIFQHKYLPSIIIYVFQINEKLNDILGTMVYNASSKVIGMIYHSEQYVLHVLPIKYINNIIEMFFQNIDQPDQYFGLLTIPINCVLEKSNIVSNALCNMQTKNGNINIKKGDIILSINNKTINKKMMIYDDTFNMNIPILNYIELNIKKDIAMHIKIIRNNKKQEIEILGKPMYQTNNITDQPYYNKENKCNYFKGLIPYINLNGMIIVRCTHELLKISNTNNMKIPSTVKINQILLISCINEKIAKEYNFGCFYNGIVQKINDIKVNSLSDIYNIECVNLQVKTASGNINIIMDPI